MSSKLYFSIAFEGMSLSALFIERFEIAMSLFLIFHYVATLLISNVLIFLLPKKYRNKKLEKLLLFQIFGFCTLFVGYIFLLITVVFILRIKKQKEKDIVQTFSIDNIYDEDIDIKGRKFGESGVISMIRSDSVNKSLKEKAFLALAGIRSPKTLSIIKENLSNPIDEIRLLAFSIISKMEKDMTSKIHDINQRLKEENISNLEKAVLYAELAQIYWDFVLYNIVDEEFKVFMLNKSKEYAFLSLKHGKDIEQFYEKASVYFLLGRIYMKLGNIDGAISFFEVSIEDERLRERTIPYMAECFYYKKDFKKVRKLFQDLKFTSDIKVKFMRDFWVGS